MVVDAVLVSRAVGVLNALDARSVVAASVGTVVVRRALRFHEADTGSIAGRSWITGPAGSAASVGPALLAVARGSAGRREAVVIDAVLVSRAVGVLNALDARSVVAASVRTLGIFDALSLHGHAFVQDTDVAVVAVAVVRAFGSNPIVVRRRAFVRPPGQIIPGVRRVVPAVCWEEFPSVAARNREEGAENQDHADPFHGAPPSIPGETSFYLQQDTRPAEGCSRDISREKQ